MKNDNSRADGCPREALTRALATTLGMPEGQTNTTEVKIDSFNNPTDRRLIALAKRSVAERAHTLVSFWTSSKSSEPSALVMIRRHLRGVEFVPVYVARPRSDRAMVLVSGDRQTLFSLTGAGAISESSCFPCARIDQAITRGQAELAVAVTDLRSTAAN